MNWIVECKWFEDTLNKLGKYMDAKRILCHNNLFRDCPNHETCARCMSLDTLTEVYPNELTNNMNTNVVRFALTEAITRKSYVFDTEEERGKFLEENPMTGGSEFPITDINASTEILISDKLLKLIFREADKCNQAMDWLDAISNDILRKEQ